MLMLIIGFIAGVVVALVAFLIVLAWALKDFSPMG